MNTFYHIFPSGVQVVHRRTASPVVYTGILVGAGTRDEAPRENGMAHYIEHCVFKGTRRLTARQLINSIEDVGGEINAYTTKEETAFYAATPVEHYARTIRLIAEMVFHPSFPKHETDKEVGVICDEIESYNDSPSELIYDDFEDLIFRGHPLAMPVLGTRRTLRYISAKPERAHAWMAQHYSPERVVIFSQGDLPFARVLHIAQQVAEQCYAPQAFERETVPPMVVDTLSYKRNTHQAHVMLGGRAFPLGHEHQLTTYMLNMILGGGSLNSRLNLNLREKHGLVYSVESQYTPLSDTGYWNVYYACDATSSECCLDLVREELRKLCTTTLSKSKMQHLLTQLRGQMAIADENRENSTLSMAKQMLYYGYSPTWQETFAKIAEVTPAALTDVANQLFAENNLSVLTYQ